MGNYSHFGPVQSPYNLRRRIETDMEGRYRFRSIMPSGYGCPPGSQTENLLFAMGRHGRRPAHVHFFVTASGHRKLTTQINIDGDKYLHDDFAFGTRDELIPHVERVVDAREIHQAGLDKPFMFLTSDHGSTLSATDQRIQDDLHSVYARLPADSRVAWRMQGADHFSSSDQLLLRSRLLRTGLMLEPSRGLAVICDAVRRFLDVHLKSGPLNELDAVRERHPEIQEMFGK
jgi:hypothetical protein